MAIFIPYVPRISQAVTEADWHLALSSWNANLLKLLRATDDQFITEVAANDSLHRFLETFLRYHADGTTGSAVDSSSEVQLAKNVLMTFLRLSELPFIDTPIVSPPNLLNLTTVYGRSNVQITRTIFNKLSARQPELVAQFVPFVSVILDCLRRIQQLYVKDTTIKHDKANGTAQDAQAHETIWNINILLSVASTLDSLFAVSCPIAQVFHDHAGFLNTVVDIYDTTLPGIRDFVGIKKGGISDGGGPTLKTKIGGVKVAFVSMLNHLLDACFFSLLGYVSSDNDPASLSEADRDAKFATATEENEPEAIVERLNDMMTWLFERSNLEGKVFAFDNAPLLVDLEIECNLSGKLARIKKERFNGDDARLEYLVLSFEQVRYTNQAKETRKERTERIRRIRTLRESQRKQANGAIMGSSGSNQHDTTDDYIHRSSLISQVQDLFPDLGEGFIEACLIVNGDDAEAVTNQLLENALPKEVANLDRSLARAPMKSVSQGDVASVTIAVQDLTLGNDPLKNRRNIFDNDEFDVFTGKSLEKNKVNLGKKARGTANQLLDDKRFVQDNKQSIIESAYNIYDDEFDDTYDDIGSAGPLDLRFVDEYDDGESAPQRGVRQQQSDPGILHESDLVQMFINDPSVFERSATARRSPGRANLRKVTQMSDEQLEGWFIMFGRNPRKQQILDKYAYEHKQSELPGSEDDNESTDDEENGEGDGSQASSQPAGPSQWGRGGPRRNDNRPPRTEAQERAWKEKNKSRNANHNRKRGHDRKMARSMGGPST